MKFVTLEKLPEMTPRETFYGKEPEGVKTGEKFFLKLRMPGAQSRQGGIFFTKPSSQIMSEPARFH
jgi:hypothetical protein